jgi:hypothetical protein
MFEQLMNKSIAMPQKNVSIDRENFHDVHYMDKMISKIQDNKEHNRKSEVVNLAQVPRESQYAFKEEELDEFADPTD